MDEMDPFLIEQYDEFSFSSSSLLGRGEPLRCFGTRGTTNGGGKGGIVTNGGQLTS